MCFHADGIVRVLWLNLYGTNNNNCQFICALLRELVFEKAGIPT
jgi:hypothetical protein